MTTIFDLPDELLALCFSFHENALDCLLVVPSVCKDWQRAAALLPKHPDSLLKSAFLQAVHLEYFISAAYILTTCEFTPTADEASDLMTELCANNYLDGAKLLTKHLSPSFSSEQQQVHLYNAIINNFLDLAQWYAATFNTISTLPWEARNQFLSFACVFGLSLELVQWVVQYFRLAKAAALCKPDIHIGAEHQRCDLWMVCRANPFEASCIHHSVAIAKWLARRFNIVAEDIHISIDDVIDTRYNWLEAADFLVTGLKMPCPISTTLTEAFSTACDNGDMGKAVWLRKKLGHDAFKEHRVEYLMRICRSGNTKMAEWFIAAYRFQTSRADLRDYDNIFEYCYYSTKMLELVWTRFNLQVSDVCAAASSIMGYGARFDVMPVLEWALEKVGQEEVDKSALLVIAAERDNPCIADRVLKYGFHFKSHAVLSALKVAKPDSKMFPWIRRYLVFSFASLSIS